MKTFFTINYIPRFFITALLWLFGHSAIAQLGIYEFNGVSVCPNPNINVTSQPSNATFSAYTTAGTSCVASSSDFSVASLNTGGSINVNEYNQFTITPGAGYALTLTSLSFTHHSTNTITSWILRSSIDNYATNIATGNIALTNNTEIINLPSGTFTNIGTVTFRLYVTAAFNGTTAWINDDVMLNGTTVLLPATPGNPTSNSPQCSNPGVTLTASGSAPVGETWYWQTIAAGTSTAISGSTYNVTTSGTYYIRSKHNTTSAWSAGAGSISVIITPNVGTPVFASGATSTRCQAAGSVTYTATSTNNTGITYTLDATSLSAGNSINASTGAVAYDASWSGTSVITATATGCNGPVSSNHTVTITPVVSTPVFTLGATSTRCQGLVSQNVTYSATANNTTGITYTLDATTDGFAGNSINTTTGVVTFSANWSGISTVTATAAGCIPQTATHSVTTTASVGTPVFTQGATSSRCQGGATVTYSATASTNTGITYSLDATSISAGNSVNASTGEVTYDAAWIGTSVITATATGCNGPKSATHTVTTNGPVTVPVFTLGTTSTRCQANNNVNYVATADFASAITYSLDAISLAGGNTINTNTGKVSYDNAWYGNSVITASAAGCYGPLTASHTVTITPYVTTPVFTSGATSTRCQGAGTINYAASSNYTTGITYSIDNASTTGGNSIHSSTGDVTFAAGWSGTTTITASAAGCNGPKTATHVVTITPSVGTPVFTAGAITTRCQAAGSVTYTATASNNTGLTYSLDAASITAGNTINTSNGTVTYDAAWSGTSIVTVTATGCNGPLSATHTVTITPLVTTPVFNAGSTSTICQGSQSITYTATANNTTGISYSLDLNSRNNGNTINSTTGAVTYSSGWTGTSTITATASGCTPQSATHTVTITATVGIPVFSSGATSTRCQAGATVTYTATATTNTGLTYSLDATSLSSGNTINSSTGTVTWDAGWYGTSVITVTATGCSGPKSATHTVTINAPVTVPVFSLGSNSVRCQGTGAVTFTAISSYTTGITYTLDASSTAGGNSINSATGVVTFIAGWTGNSVITASAAGCAGPKTSTLTVTTTPYVTTPLFVAGSSSIRCQGAASLNYAASSNNTTGLTYSLDTASITGGNTINATNGDVTFSAGWSGTTLITASAAGCNGPNTAIHTVTTTATVGTPVFALGTGSVRSKGAQTKTFTATATTSTGLTYSLDAASISGGNSVNVTTGAVTFAASWQGTSIITATAAGCNGPSSSTHTVITNAVTAIKQLYLADPFKLDRVDPVATNDITTTTTVKYDNGDSVIFTQAVALTSPLTIKGGTINIINYLSGITGTMPLNPNITARISYSGNTIISMATAAYNSATATLTWTGTLAEDVTIPTGGSIVLVVKNLSAADFKIDYNSKTKPSRIELPVSTFINVNSIDVFDAPYPAGKKVISAVDNRTVYARAVVTDPFGAADITSMDISINPGSISAGMPVATSSANTKIFEYPFTTASSGTSMTLLGSAKEGYENTVTHSQGITLSVCSICPPVALDDSISGAGGAPLLIDVIANDYDPNENMNAHSISVVTPPKNGDAIISSGKFVYVPNGTFAGKDTFSYQVCDSTMPTALCATANVYVTIDPTISDPCTDATKSQVYYLPYAETEARVALLASQNQSLVIDSLRDIISLKMPYPGMVVIWDQWEDGYETDILNPAQTSTLVWGDANPYNGIAPGFSDDIIPAGGGIVLDNIVPANPRGSNIYYDGKDKVYASGQISVVQVIGEPLVVGLQCMKTNVSSTQDYGKSFTIPVGQNFPSQDFSYTAAFIRASHNNTVVDIDKDNNGSYDLKDTLSEGETLLVSGIYTGASITSSSPIGVDLHFAGVDGYSSREVPVFPANWYSSTYYSPVPTTGAGTAIKDTNAVYLYNNLNRSISINWSSGIPSSGSIVIPAKTVTRFALPLSATAAYKFVNPTGESFTALQVCDSYTPGGGGNTGTSYDWAFNLISEDRLTTFATLAWAPGSIDGTRNDNPVWVTPTANTTIYVKYNGDLTNGGSISPCGLRYDISYPLNALNHKRVKDLTDNDQSGMAVYTCDGTRIAAVYGEDPSTATPANPSWDVGSTMRPFCSLKLIFANDDYAFTATDNPVTIPILINDVGFAATINPASVITAGLLQPKHGTVVINSNGTLLYTPHAGYQGNDTLEYSVCSTPSPVVCDIATVYITINSCPPPASRNIIYGKVFIDQAQNGINNTGDPGFKSGKVLLYVDGNCNNIAEASELSDSLTVDSSGTYQFIKYPEKTVSDNFEGLNGGSSCSTGNTGNTPWSGNWVDAGDASTGFCVTLAQSINNTNAEVVKDGSFGYAMRLKQKNISVSRSVNLIGATYAFLSFAYRKASTTLTAGHDVYVQVSSNGGLNYTTIFTIQGNGTVDPAYVHIYNQDISAYASATTVLRFLTSNGGGNADSVFIDNISIKYLKYPQCYIVKVPTSSVPQNYYMTTSNQAPVSFAGTGNCAAPVDFGVASLSVLPIGVLNFKGYSSGNDDILNWTTEREFNTDRYETEVRTNAGNFEKIGTVKAKGGSSTRTLYSFNNRNVPAGTNYYRLKIFDNDGKFNYSNIIVLKRNSATSIVNKVYPNPFKDKVLAEVNLETASMIYIKMYDGGGRLVKNFSTPGVKGLNVITVDRLEKFSSGVYHIEIKYGIQEFHDKLFKSE